MDTKDIRYFMECFETRSLNRAARELFITPQGLGRALDRIEQELRISLFTRTPRGLVPTQAGIYFYGRAQKLMNELQQIEEGMEDFREQKTRLRIGYSCGLLRMHRTAEVERFGREHPDLILQWEEGANELIRQRLLKGMLDLAFVIGRTASAGLVEQELFSRQVCAVVREDDPLSTRQELSTVDLRGRELISLNENYQLYTSLISSCEREGFRPIVRIRTMEAAMIYSLVADGLGVGVDADIHRWEILPDQVRCIPIRDFLPWQGYLVYPSDSEKQELIRCFLAQCVNPEMFRH